MSAPGAPTGITAAPSSGAATLTFTAGATNGSSITNYKYSTDGTNYTALSPAQASSPITISGLTNYTWYTIYLKAVNANGDSVASASVNVMPSVITITPNSISGIQVWYDGRDPAGTSVLPSNGAAVSTWVNKVSGSFNATATSGKEATYDATQKALTFVSGKNYSTGYTGAPATETMFVVFKNPAPNINNNTLIAGELGARGFGAGFANGATNSIGVLNNQVAWLAIAGGIYAPNSVGIGTTTVSSTGATTTVALNGGTIYTRTGGTPFTAGTTTHLGIDTVGGGTTYYFTGSAMEIIIYNTALTTTQKQQVEGYLAWKWGIQSSLPSAHPYSPLAAPTSLVATVASATSVSIAFSQTLPVTNYKYSTDGANYTAFSPAQASSPITISGLTNYTWYTIYLKAVNASGDSVASAGVSVMPSVISITPNSISGLQVWYDGRDPAGTSVLPSNGAAVSTWKNKASGSFNATATSGKEATYDATQKALTFVSGKNYSTGYTAAPATETMFVVFKNTSPSSNNSQLISGTGGARGFAGGSAGGLANNIGLLNNNQAWLATTPQNSYTSNTVAIGTGTISSTGATTTIALNGGTSYSATGQPSFTAGTTTYLGLNVAGPTIHFNGSAMEIIIYNTALNTTQTQQVEGYLAWKWGIQSSLPSDHPYAVLGVPTSVTAAQNTSDADTAVTVSWSKPTVYGSTIQSYTVTSNPDGRTALATGENTLSATVTGLTSNTAYTFTVTAYNGSTTSAASAASSSITPRVSSVAGSVSGAPGSNVAVGSSTALSLSGSTGTAWQWQSSTDNATFSNIVGATSSTYSTSNANSTNSNATVYYRAVVTNYSRSSATTAAISVTTAPSSVAGTISSANVGNLAYGDNSTALTLSGYRGTIQWQSSTDNTNFTNVDGATDSTYTPTNLTATKYYRAVVTSSPNTAATTSSTTLTVDGQTTLTGINARDNNQNTDEGTTPQIGYDKTVTLTLSGVTGTVQWSSSPDNSTWTNIGTNSSTYTSGVLQSRIYYKATVKNGNSASITSDTVTVTVDSASAVGTVTATYTTIGYNESTTLSVSSTTGTVYWQSSLDNGVTYPYTDIASATGTSYIINNGTASKYYRVRVVNGESDTVSALGILITVDAASVAGTITGAETHASYNRTKTLTLSSYTGSIVWKTATTLAGTYTVISGETGASYTTPALTATTYYKAVVTNGESDPAESLVTVIVDAKSASTVTASGTTSYTYNGSAQGPSSTSNVTGSAETVTYSYSGTANGGASYGPSSTKPTNAGSYTMVATVAEDNYYLGGSSSAYSFTIGKGASTISATGTQSFTYNASSQGPASSSKTGSASSATYSYVGISETSYGPSSTAPTNAGTYQVTASVTADNNYNSASSSAYSFSIAKANSTISVTGNVSFPYNATPIGPTTYSKTGSSGLVTYTYVGVSGTTYSVSSTKPTNIGSYTTTATIAADSNYNSASSSAYSFTIVKGYSTLQITGDVSYEYNGSARGPSTSTVTGSTGAVTYSYQGRGNTTYGPSSTAPTVAGKYFVDATVSADTNYLTDSNRFIFEILAQNSQPSEDSVRINRILDNVGGGTNSFTLNLQDFVTTDTPPEYIPGTIGISISEASNGSTPVEITFATGESVSVDGLPNGFFAAVGVDESAVHGTFMTINFVDDQGNVPTTPTTLTLTLPGHEGESGVYIYI